MVRQSELQNSKERLQFLQAQPGKQYDGRPFLSANGYVGLTPARSQPGDIACIAFAANIPFVLRTLPSGLYELMGEADVHGIMDGEFMETCPPLETFHIH
jgi:hypothetical protein